MQLSLSVMTRWLAILILILLPAPLYAELITKTIHIEWEYGGVATSFRLYQDGYMIHESFDTKVLAMDVITQIPDDRDIVYTMTAVGPYGETPHSAPFILNVNDTEPSIITDPVIPDPVLPDPILPDPIITDPIIYPEVILSITFNWEYTGSVYPDGFKLYHNNKLLKVVGPDIRTTTTLFNASFTDDNVFTVSAYIGTTEYLLTNKLSAPKYNLIDHPKNIRIE